MKSRAPSGVGLNRIGVWMSRKPGCLHVAADDPDHLRPQAAGCAAACRGAGRASGSAAGGSRRRSPRRAGTEAASSGRRSRSSSTWSSTSPVGIFGFTVSGERAATSPRAWSTNSLRISCASSAAAGERSGLITSCVTPVRSRRSTNTSPPWSRRRATQPARARLLPDVLRAELAAHQVAPAHDPDSLPTISAWSTASSAAPVARNVALLGADDDRHTRAEPRRPASAGP